MPLSSTILGLGWFAGIDVFFSFGTMLIAILVASYARTAYNFTKKDSHRYLNLSFLTLALAFAIKGALDVSIYYDVATRYFGLSENGLGLTSHVAYNTMYYIYATLSMLGYALLAKLALNVRGVWQSSIFGFMIVYSLLIMDTVFYGFFYVTMAIFLAYAVLFFYQNYNAQPSVARLRILLAFVLILVGNAMFSLLLVKYSFYAISHAVRMFGFGLLAYHLWTLGRSKPSRRR